MIPDDVAAASFLAFGSSAPEIVMNVFGTAHKKTAGMSLSAIIGSAIIAFTLIPAGHNLHLFRSFSKELCYSTHTYQKKNIKKNI